MPALLRLLPVLIPLVRRTLRNPTVRTRLHLKPLPDQPQTKRKRR